MSIKVIKNQVIKKFVDIFDDYIKVNLPMENNYYILNYISYKKLVYKEKIDCFLEELKKYYFFNKQYYVTRRPNTYKNFTTVVRQICNRNGVVFETSSKYDNGKYCPEYRIYDSNVMQT
jgi:hypothetical protein